MIVTLAIAGGRSVIGNWVPPDSTADLVYGQFGDFTTSVGATTADNLRGPRHMVTDSSGNLYVSDTSNNRVLYYPAGSTTATRVYGQFGSLVTSFANTGGVSANSLSGPRGLAIDNLDSLYVADTNNNRVLHYPTNSTTADRVYGQGGFTGGTPNNPALGANTLFSPQAVA